jgi:2-polyprenyl-6-methoxyphenol hydroxylase-like FAD-dependent oxidoreductase
VVVLRDGSRHQFDLVVGADGYRSRTRLSIFPDSPPVYAGYPAWRGLVDEADGIVTDLSPVVDAMQSVGTTRGHCLFYFVPGANGETTEGHRRLNWLWYDAGVPDDVLGVTYDDKHRAQVAAIAPGEMTAAQLEYLHRIAGEQLPAWHADVVRRTPKPFAQQMFDLEPISYVSGNVCLIGDAASVARPHTGTGTTKAIQDGLALAAALADHDTIAEALAAYDRERCAAGRQLVQMGRMLGVEQVNEAPPWGDFTPEQLTEWLSTMTISKVYAWADAR